MLKFGNSRRKKLVQYTVTGTVLALFLLGVTLSHSYSVMAAAPDQKMETGSGKTASNIAALASPVPPTVPSLVVNVNPANAALNATISVEMTLWNIQNIYGMQTTCQVNPKILQGTTHSDGDVFNSANSFFVDKGFQADGTWIVGASRLQPNPFFSGNGIGYKLNYIVKAVAPSAVTCTVLAVDVNGKVVTLNVVNGSFNGALVVTSQPTAQPTAQPSATPTLTPTVVGPTPTATKVTGATVSGKILYQNYPDNSKITVQLVTMTGAVITSMTTGADGSYVFNNVPVGTFGVTAIGNLYLRIGKVVTITSIGQTIDLGSMTLPGGDTDNSGDVSLTDASLVGANFGNAVNPAPASADVNGDKVINIRDLAIIGGNFGLKAPILIK